MTGTSLKKVSRHSHFQQICQSLKFIFAENGTTKCAVCLIKKGCSHKHCLQTWILLFSTDEAEANAQTAGGFHLLRPGQPFPPVTINTFLFKEASAILQHSSALPSCSDRLYLFFFHNKKELAGTQARADSPGSI